MIRRMLVAIVLPAAILAVCAWSYAAAPGAPTPPGPSLPKAPAPPTPPAPPAPPSPTPPGPGDGVKPTPPTGVASIKVLAIRATKEDRDFMDPSLATLAAELRRSGAGFNCFRLLMQVPRTVPFGEMQSIPLVEGYSLRVKPVSATGSTIDLAVGMSRGEGGGLSTNISLPKGKYFLLAGFKLQEGKLLAAISGR